MESNCANVGRGSQLGAMYLDTSREWSRLRSYLQIGLDESGRGLKRSQPMGRLTAGEHSHWMSARG
jgi:hypothetical protein